MRIIIAECEVVYQGRGYTKLEPAVRAILIKADGAISVHADYNGNKPLNYMPAGYELIIETHGENEKWVFQGKKESIEILMRKIISDNLFELAEYEPGLQKENTEKDLQAFLAGEPSSILSHFMDSSLPETIREYNTKAGAVDILYLNHEQKIAYIVEVKRIAMLGAVDQCRRYRSAFETNLDNQYSDYKIHTIIAAWDIRPNTKKLAERHGIVCIEVQKPS
jgi:endonuclease